MLLVPAGSYRGAGRGMNVTVQTPVDDSAKKRRVGRRPAGTEPAQEDENSLYSIIRQGKAGLQVRYSLEQRP